MENNKEAILDSEHWKFVEEVNLTSINTKKFPEAYRQQALRAMESYSASQNEELRKELRELKNKCESDYLSIDELLKEFTRCGFNTENWDGDEGAEKAIVKGVCVYMEERQEKLFDKQVEDHLKLTQLQSTIDEKNKEIERLKGLLERYYKSQWHPDMEGYSELKWQQFKTENHL